MNLVSTPFFSILLNGSPTRILNPSRGIIQGDPLSPFLFILMDGGLNKLFQYQSYRGEIHGINLHEGMDKLTHQKLVDDTMLMGHPSFQEAQAFKKSLIIFSRASALEVNSNKL